VRGAEQRGDRASSGKDDELMSARVEAGRVSVQVLEGGKELKGGGRRKTHQIHLRGFLVARR